MCGIGALGELSDPWAKDALMPAKARYPNPQAADCNTARREN
jgi:hypothetical protein